MPLKKNFYEALAELENHLDHCKNLSFVPSKEKPGYLTITYDDLCVTVNTNRQFEAMSHTLFGTENIEKKDATQSSVNQTPEQQQLQQQRELINQYKILFEAVGILHTSDQSAIPYIDNVPLSIRPESDKQYHLYAQNLSQNILPSKTWPTLCPIQYQEISQALIKHYADHQIMTNQNNALSTRTIDKTPDNYPLECPAYQETKYPIQIGQHRLELWLRTSGDHSQNSMVEMALSHQDNVVNIADYLSKQLFTQQEGKVVFHVRGIAAAFLCDEQTPNTNLYTDDSWKAFHQACYDDAQKSGHQWLVAVNYKKQLNQTYEYQISVINNSQSPPRDSCKAVDLETLAEAGIPLQELRHIQSTEQSYNWTEQPTARSAENILGLQIQYFLETINPPTDNKKHTFILSTFNGCSQQALPWVGGFCSIAPFCSYQAIVSDVAITELQKTLPPKITTLLYLLQHIMPSNVSTNNPLQQPLLNLMQRIYDTILLPIVENTRAQTSSTAINHSLEKERQEQEKQARLQQAAEATKRTQETADIRARLQNNAAINAAERALQAQLTAAQKHPLLQSLCQEINCSFKAFQNQIKAPTLSRAQYTDALQQFRTSSQEAIQKAYRTDAIQRHVDSQQILKNIAACLAGLIILYALCLVYKRIVTGQWSLFFQNNAIKQIDKLDSAVTNIQRAYS